jgi:hypothetical protein
MAKRYGHIYHNYYDFKFRCPESRLKTEGVKERIGSATLNRVGFGTLHQFLSKAMSSHAHGNPERSHMQPSSPNISKQTAHKLTIFALEKESDRVPFSLSGTGNVMIDDNRFHEVVHLGGGIGVEYYISLDHTINGPTDMKTMFSPSTKRGTERSKSLQTNFDGIELKPVLQKTRK